MTDTPPETHPTDTVPGEVAPQQPVPSTVDPSAVPGPASAPGVETPSMVDPSEQGPVPDGFVPTPDPVPALVPTADTGDTPAPAGDVHHVDTSDQVDIDPEGDRTEAGHVSRVEVAPDNVATAGDLRQAGYTVDPRIPDDQVPGAYMADSPTPTGEIRPVTVPQPDDKRRLTPMQFINETQDVPEDAPAPSPHPDAPPPAPAPETTKEGNGDGTVTKEGDTAGGTVS